MGIFIRGGMFIKIIELVSHNYYSVGYAYQAEQSTLIYKILQQVTEIHHNGMPNYHYSTAEKPFRSLPVGLYNIGNIICVYAFETQASVAHSVWNFAQSMAVILPHSVQNFKSIGQLKLMLSRCGLGFARSEFKFSLIWISHIAQGTRGPSQYKDVVLPV